MPHTMTKNAGNAMQNEVKLANKNPAAPAIRTSQSSRPIANHMPNHSTGREIGREFRPQADAHFDSSACLIRERCLSRTVQTFGRAWNWM